MDRMFTQRVITILKKIFQEFLNYLLFANTPEL